MIHFMERECNVSPYTDAYKPINSVMIACDRTAWTSPASGKTYILVFNEVLWMGDKMDHILVNPKQMRHFGIKVQNNPYDDSPLYLMTEDGNFALPLAVQGTNIMADACTLNEEELQTCKHINLSSQHPCDPHRVWFTYPTCTVQEEVGMFCTIGDVSVNQSNDQESAEEDFM